MSMPNLHNFKPQGNEPEVFGPFEISTKHLSKVKAFFAISAYIADPRVPALELYDDQTFEPLMRASVLPEFYAVEDDCIFIKDYSENEGIEQTLLNLRFIESPPIASIATGWVSVNQYKMSGDLLKAWHAFQERLALNKKKEEVNNE